MKKLVIAVFFVLPLLWAVVTQAAAPFIPASGGWSPANNSTNVDENTSIVITFNSNPALLAASINATNVYMKTGNSCSRGTSVPVSLSSSLASPTSTVTVTPSSPLASGQQYVVCARRSTRGTLGIRNTSNEHLTNSNLQTVFTVRDYIIPTVTSWSPNPPSGVQTNTNPTIQITFSERMLETTITTASVLLENMTDGGSVAINNPTFTNLTSPNRTRANFTLPAPLTSPKTYQVTVKNTVTDLAGNPMDADFSWEFSIDNTAPTVISYAPYTAETPVFVNSSTPQITALFTEAIQNPTTSNFYLRTGATTIGTTPSFDSLSNTAILTLNGGVTLVNNTTYTATLLGGTGTSAVNCGSSHIKDTACNTMASSVSWSFTVDTQAPVVGSVSPVDGASNVPVGAQVLVNFTENQTMRESTINGATVIVSDGTNTIPCTLSYSAANKRLTITAPGGSFAYNTTYTVTLGGGIADMAGNLLPGYSFSFTTHGVSSVVYTQVPPFLNAPVTPNILIIFDNSNSMDEDMQVNAIGSPFCSNNADPNTCSKSIIGRKALTNIINTYSDKMRIGLMTYRLSGASAYRLHNSFYFTSYDPATYCPNPPVACYDYCVTENTTSRDACNAGCQPQNALFNATVRDEIINSGAANATAINSDRRKNYCSLIYPKYQRMPNPADPANFVYYALPGTLYSSSNLGTRYLYSTGYSPAVNSDSYAAYSTKIGTSNANVGYANQTATYSFTPTDSDLALGFDDFGRRLFWYYTSRTWYRGDSPGPGYLHVQANINDPVNNTQKNALLAKLQPFENDETGYMTCTATDRNTCPHIINAGNTPTEGTLQTAIDYFKGTLVQEGAAIPSPIQYTCQRNFIIYVTDGLPSTNAAGVNGSADTLLPGSITKLQNLRCPESGATSDNCKVFRTFGATNKNFDVKTFVLGMGLNSAAKQKLDALAVAGGVDNAGKAYYADNQTELNNALLAIFQNILTQLSSGTAASILNNSEGSGANMLQAVFYPKKTFPSGSEVNWVGEMQNLWYYIDPFFQKTSIREDTNQDNKLNLKDDKIAQFYFDGAKTQVALFSDLDGDGVADGAQTTIEPDDVKSLWKAGRLLWARNVADAAPTGDPRTIYTGYNATSGSTPTLLDTLVSNAGAQDALQLPGSTAKATKLVNWLKGIDQPADADGTLYRSRMVTIAGCGLANCTREWKLGDIIASTPKLVSSNKLNNYDVAAPKGYGDKSYKVFTESSTYKTRGMVFVGANDGMLHAFKLGVLKMLDGSFDKAQMNNESGNKADASDKLGREEWAFIPSQVLPYLKYMTETNYNHLFYVDKTPTVIDASIGKPSGCTATSYVDCSKDETAGTNWRTVLIGGAGLGGASRNSTDTCSAVNDCVKTPMDGNGFSSYFALDVTNPATPKYMWEFPAGTTAAGSMGFATSGPAIVRISKIDKDTSVTPVKRTPNHTKNGNWFALFASGPTGPIEQTNHEFRGQSDQNLKLFVVDLGTGELKRIIDTGIANAFAGNITGGVIDTDQSKPSSPGWYSDDAVYIGYVKKDTATGTWTKGGVLRLLTFESDDPADWTTSVLIDQVKVGGTDTDIGPVTTSVAKLLDKKGKFDSTLGKYVPELWIYFGTGRYFYKNDDTTSGTTQKLFGVKEPCYTPVAGFPVGGDLLKYDGLNKSANCNDKAATNLLDQSGDAATAPAATIGTAPGWFIQLDPKQKVCSGDSSTSCTTDSDCGTDKGSCYEYNAERVITDPVASTAGVVLFTTFKPSADICLYGGDSLIWGSKYDTGSAPPASTMQGKALMQVSTGAFQEISLASAFSNPDNKRLDLRRLAVPITGVPPTSQGLSLLTNPQPVKKILQIQEK